MTDSEFQGHMESLDTQMECGIFSNAQGDILIVHDKALSSAVEWVEYNPQERSISLVYDGGAHQDLGVELDEATIANLSHGMEISLSYIADEAIQSTQSVTFIIQDY